MEGGEGPERGLPGEELEAALGVLDPPHTEEPHQEVEAVHQEGAEHGALRSQTWLQQARPATTPSQTLT